MKLLEKAKKIKVTRDSKLAITKELTELTLAWVKDEITLQQASTVLGKQSQTVLSLFANVLKVYLLDAKNSNL